MELEQVPHRRFAVVARLRPGGPVGVSADEVSITIRERLLQFLNDFVIKPSPPGFIIETSSASFQLQLLGCRTLDGDGFVLQLVPWCPEYESCDMPWIVADDAEVTARPAKPYMDNLVVQPKPLRSYVLGVLSGRIDHHFSRDEAELFKAWITCEKMLVLP